MSRRNTSKSCMRFCCARDVHVPVAADEDENSSLSEDEGDDHKDAKEGEPSGESKWVNFKWINPLLLLFPQTRRVDLVDSYAALDREMQDFKALDGVWCFKFTDRISGESIEKKVRMTEHNEHRAFQVDNLLTNNCMLEKVLEALLPDIPASTLKQF